jgi:hypothetical protein
MKKFAALVLIAAFCLGCKSGDTASIERQELFSLDIGPMEDQIALYSLGKDNAVKRARSVMRDGLFYVADGPGSKIVRYNSYGDLLFMIYNEETNGEPISLKTNFTGSEQATRWAFSYPLREPSAIAVDSRKHIYVKDLLPQQSSRYDSENKTMLDGIILHFDSDGRFIEYLGQEGIGGSPYPLVLDIFTSVNDELAVICRIPDGWNIYWYDQWGMLLYLIKISNSTIPARPDWPSSLASLERIIASPDSRKLFIKVDYYVDTFDVSTNTRTGSEPGSSMIWVLNIEDGSYITRMEAPLYELSEGNQHLRLFYSFLGVMRDEKVLLNFPLEDGYSVLFLDVNSRWQRRGFVRFSNDELKFNDFSLSAEGILSAMLVDDFKVKMVCWRTDAFIGDL